MDRVGRYYPETVLNYEYDALTQVSLYGSQYATSRSFSNLAIGSVYLLCNTGGATSDRANAMFSCTGGDIISIGSHGCTWDGKCLVLFKATSTSVTIRETTNFSILYEGTLFKVE